MTLSEYSKRNTAFSPPHFNSVSFRRILVALDLSKMNPVVLKAALAVAGLFRSELFLLHAAGSFAELAYSEPEAPVMLSMELEAAEAAMADLIAREPWLSCYRHSVVVENGSTIDLVKRVVASESIDLVVVGSHGATGLDRVALGSVAEALVRHVQCPVLIVGPHAITDSAMFSSVLLATNLGSTGTRAASYAASLTEQHEGTLYLLHVVASKILDGLTPALPDSVVELALSRLLPEQLRTSPKIKLCISDGDAAAGILRLAHEKLVTVIITGVSEGSAWDGHSPFSTFSEVIHNAPCPVLAVRDAKVLSI